MAKRGERRVVFILLLIVLTTSNFGDTAPRQNVPSSKIRSARSAFIPSRSAREDAPRTYDIAEKDGSITGSKGHDNFNLVLENIKGNNSHKSAGQIFSENLHAGTYTPYGVIEDTGDKFGESAQFGKTSEDKTYIEDVHAKIYQKIGSVAGGAIDVVGDNLVPKALDPVLKGAVGALAAGLGGAWGVFSSPVASGVEAAKVGLNGVGYGGLMGLEGKVRDVNATTGEVSHVRESWFGGLGRKKREA